MRTIAAFFLMFSVFAPGCVPDGNDSCGSSDVHNTPPPPPAACSPVVEPTLTGLTFTHEDGRPWAVGDTIDYKGLGLDTGSNDVGGKVMVVGLALTGTVGSCLLPHVQLGYLDKDEPTVPKPTADGANMSFWLGTWHLTDAPTTVTATVGDRTIKATLVLDKITALD